MKSKYLFVMPLVLGVILITINIKVTQNELIGDITPSTELTSVNNSNIISYEEIKTPITKAKKINADYGKPELKNINKDYNPNSYGRRSESETIAVQSMALVEEEINAVNLIGSVTMMDLRGIEVNTDEVQIDTEALMELYEEVSESPAWDVKEKIDIIELLWEFLVNQCEMSPMNAAALIGNIVAEGKFAEQQGTGLFLNNIEQARTLLGCGKKGYGIVQWTYAPRQRALLEYYELAYELYPEDWDRVKVTAECSMLIEEIKAYKIFDDIKVDTSIEDATGRVCVNYEAYKGSNRQWTKQNNTYRLVAGKSSNGYQRLAYAKSVYEYFSN